MQTPQRERALVPFAELHGLLASIFERHGASPEVAAILADNCASVQRDGAESHGTFRIPGYLATLASGWVDAKAVPVVTDAAPGYVSVDAMNGFAQPALAAARALVTAKARANGIALLAIHNSHHFSALWPDVEPFARDGLVALAFVNSMACVVPHGGQHALFGTNPIAFAAPRAGADPLVFDLATSAMAHGDVQIAAREGQSLPEGVGVDRAGKPTRTPAAVLDGGALCPFGGHKGSALSMMVEILAAALTGGNFSFEFNWSGHPGAQTPRTGQLLIVIDPARQAGNGFAARIETLVREMRAAGQERQPGERRYLQRAASERDGVPIAATELEGLRRLAAPAGTA
ncbi:Ldh family oxidoreductase [Massilia sp. RP-1-19]|uniref:Delta(1)-pyrroline-2-carboxylate/Delta(1)-piperideine-2-carboxylate reductase n=1 Tax=Massilia polaris TaxID=2728846 RepID=A0A848HL07_9BURK|nr:Ldh family oxidoreductase [Massilia polaris]NML60870.1 Ldh family oxidoreductase [Massilia polaris]